MTVVELVEKLLDCEPDDMVYIESYDCENGCGNCEVVELDTTEVGVVTLGGYQT